MAASGAVSLWLLILIAAHGTPTGAAKSRGFRSFEARAGLPPPSPFLSSLHRSHHKLFNDVLLGSNRQTHKENRTRENQSKCIKIVGSALRAEVHSTVAVWFVLLPGLEISSFSNFEIKKGVCAFVLAEHGGGLRII